MADEDGVYWLKDLRINPDVIHPYTEALCDMPLIIDNGSYNCRVGWASDDKPRLLFRNCYAKQRKDRGKKNAGDPDLLVGNDISNLEANRFQLKSPHDENIVTHFEGQELMLDYVFTHLGISSTSVDHPVVMTEALCNPNYSRQCMSELLFECYGIPKVSYAIDGMLSFHHNCVDPDGLVINIGNCTTHVMPVVNHHVDAYRSRRIRIGGQHLTRYLWRWLQLRFPQHLTAITLSRAEEILFSHVHIAEDYSSQIAKWKDMSYYEKQLLRVQLPYTAQVSSTMTVEQQKERKREAAKRLSEMNAKKREEKLEEDLEEFDRLVELEEAMEEFSPDEAEYQHALEEAQVTSLQDLQKKILLLQQRIDKAKLKISQSSSFKEEEIEEPKPKRMFECAPESKEEKEVWLKDVKQRWRDIHSRKAARRHHRLEMAKRRTAASQERMRIISQLAKREKKEDNFGMRDEDWDVYKAINKDGGGSDSEEDDEKLQELEVILKHHLPEFLGESSASKKVSMAENYQLLLSTEQIRIGELLFQPSMYGIEQGGIADTVEYILKLYDHDLQTRLVGNIFVTGGAAQIPGIKSRLETEMLAMRPFQSKFRVQMAKNPELDPWFGARGMITELVDSGITRQQYEECGGDYIRSHKAGNKYWQPKIPQPDSAAMTSEGVGIADVKNIA